MDKNIFVCLLAVLLPCLAVAHDFEVDGIYYNITSEENSTVGVTGPSNKKVVDGGYKFYKDVVFIPEKVIVMQSFHRFWGKMRSDLMPLMEKSLLPYVRH